ncbi:RNA-binding cell elongation regulator Jag/EloR [Clostridium sp. ZS2-4]|uniref:RNA-binding cell elongation regulator Jag/EloR n=1 Tax=Clostridium sp. ZS2-4 TaxID=2987703 RepID=UPI00227B0D31|nr:RNA-binding cell elongation regulator Jag/EloR [Clostridium sp. ZS2-4]MCY6356374.1 protein jag [Clostridium sp. ZS2-4]
MKSIEMAGRTVEEAVQNALKVLNVTEDKVEIEVIDEGSKGLFKIFKGKEAKVKVTVKKDYKDEAKDFLRKVLDSMGILSEIKVTEEKDVIKINLIGPNMGLIIGYRGETLDSLQYLVNLAVNKDNEGKYKKITLDTENYRAKREETLKRLAGKMAYKVRKTNKAVKLEPMNPYERRVIHSALQDEASIVTYSEGEEPHRRVVIDLKKKA